MIETIFAILTTGAGGGIIGGVFALFKQREERKERLEVARIQLERDKLDHDAAQKEREHEALMLERNAEHELRRTMAEGDIEAEVATLEAIGTAQATLAELNTTPAMDNYRASVRPSLAYWGVLLFTVLLSWAFYEFKDTITADKGGALLENLISTLVFITTSIISYYYVSRRNHAPRS